MAQDLYVGATFTGERATALIAALGEAWRTIFAALVGYTILLNSEVPMFAATGRAVRLHASLLIAPESLQSARELPVSSCLWRPLLRRLGT